MQNTVKTENTANINTATSSVPRITTRKIGGTTFVVSSSFNSTGKGDVVSKISRLIRDELEKGA